MHVLMDVEAALLAEKRAQHAVQVADLQSTLRRKLLNSGSGGNGSSGSANGSGIMSQHGGVASAAASAAGSSRTRTAQQCIVCRPSGDTHRSQQLAQQRWQHLHLGQSPLQPSVTRLPRHRGVACMQPRPLAAYRLLVT